jgi:phosphoserine phosphatase RsbU/P
MNQDELSAHLAQVPLFASLPAAEVDSLLGVVHPPCWFEAGQLLMKEGEQDDYFFILLEGEVEVIKALETPDQRLLSVKSGGSTFGEMSLFERHGFHTASVRARTPALALGLSLLEFDGLLQRCPRLAYEMMSRLSRRLEESENLTIQDLREKNRQLSQAYQELQAAQAQIIIKEKLEKELAIARQIQESTLPDELPQVAGFDLAALTIPAQAVGGDYYDVFSLGGGCTGLVVGDACDKGIPAALLINLANSLIHVEARRSASPEQTLRRVNQHLLDIHHSGMFVTALYGVLAPDGQLNYCRAGHPHPLVVGPDNQPVETGSSPGMALGLLVDIGLDSRSVMIPAGGMVVMFSDGLSEAFDRQGKEFGVDGLIEALPELNGLPAEAVCRGLWNRVKAFSDGLPQADDFTVVVIKRGM